MISGLFDFRVREEFKDAYTKLAANPEVHEVAVDLSETDYLDSTALGMLLNLNNHSLASSKSVAIINATGVSLKVLQVAKFDQVLEFRQG